MARDARDSSEFLPPHGGLTNRIAQRIGLLQPPAWRRGLRILVLIAITWLPLLLLASLTSSVTIPLWRDPEVHSRYLLSLPLLDLGEMVLLASLAVQIRQFGTAGVVSSADRPRFDAAISSIQRWHATPFAELILFALALGCAVLARLVLAGGGDSSWERHLGRLTPAGWWHMLVSLPILYFFLFRTLWISLLWTLFLIRIARLDLALTPTHPDRAGGLGFLGWGLTGFAPTVLACSTGISAGFAYEIYHRGESLNTLRFHLIVYVVLATVIVHLPLIAFVGRLWHARFEGLLEFGSLAQRHDRAFDEKWIQSSSRNPSPLGSQDLQSMTGMADAYNQVGLMRWIPFDRLAVASIVLAAVVPLLPLIGTEIPFSEIVTKLFAFFV